VIAVVALALTTSVMAPSAAAQEPEKSTFDVEFEAAYKLMSAKDYGPAAQAFITLGEKTEPGEQQATVSLVRATL
jgi:hypothetical protein